MTKAKTVITAAVLAFGLAAAPAATAQNAAPTGRDMTPIYKGEPVMGRYPYTNEDYSWITAPRTGAPQIVSAGAMAAGAAAGAMMPENDMISFNHLTASMNQVEDRVAKLRSMKNLMAEQVQLVNVMSVTWGWNQEEINRSFEQARERMGLLHEAIGQSSTLKELMDDKNLDHDQIVAVDVLDGGKIIMYYHDENVYQQNKGWPYNVQNMTPKEQHQN